MGLRGPKPGAARRKTEASKAAAAAALQPMLGGPPAITLPPIETLEQPLSAAQRENPRFLEGEALKKLAHRNGMAKSEVADMPDAKIREQLRFRTQHLIDENNAAA